MQSGLNILNLGLMAVLLVAAMSVHARGLSPAQPNAGLDIPSISFSDLN